MEYPAQCKRIVGGPGELSDAFAAPQSFSASFSSSAKLVTSTDSMRTAVDTLVAAAASSTDRLAATNWPSFLATSVMCRQPRLASSRAIESPMPLLPPVITACWSSGFSMAAVVALEWSSLAPACLCGANDGKKLRFRRTRIARLGMESSNTIGDTTTRTMRAGRASIPAVDSRRRWPWGKSAIVVVAHV